MSETHPHWCSPTSCTAYSDAMTDLLYHRSEPVIIPTEDDWINIYIYRIADSDGRFEYVEVAELDEPVHEPWYLQDPRDRHGAELSLRLEAAEWA